MSYRLKGKGAYQEATCADISGLGVKLCLKEELIEGNCIEVVFYFKDDSSAFRGCCRVRWCRKLKEDNFQVGLEFLKVKDKAYFDQVICERMLMYSLAGEKARD